MHVRPVGFVGWRSRLSVLLVAFLAAVVVLIGPTTTQDKAQALVVPPVIPAVGAITMPGAATVATGLAFTPAGAAIMGLGIGAFFLFGGDDYAVNLAEDGLCWLGFGGPECTETDGTGTRQDGVHQVVSNPYAEYTVTVDAGPAPHLVTWHSTCANRLLDDYCQQAQAANSMGPASAQVHCKNAAGARYAVNFQLGAGAVTQGETSGGYIEPIYRGQTSAVCKFGESALSMTWWHSDASNRVYAKPGSWTSGVAPPDGDVKVRIDTTCARPDGTTYVRTGPVTTDKTAVALGCEPPDVAVASEVFSGTGTTTGPMTSKGRVAVSPEAKTDYSECLTATGATTCTTDVVVDGVTCSVNVAACKTWYSLDQDRVRCMWGPYSMPLSSCDPLREAYKTGYVTPNRQRTGVYDAINPDGSPYSPPTTAPQPQPLPRPNPNPGGSPGTGTDPNTSEGADPDGDGNCWAGVISWNPVDWVTTPVKCALVWAFVPKDSAISDTVTGVGQSFAVTGVGQWFGAFGGIVAASSGGGEGSCRGPAWNVGSTWVTDAQTFYPFSACSGPQAVIAQVVRIGLTVVVWFGAAVVSLRLLGSAMGLNLNGVGGRDEDA